MNSKAKSCLKIKKLSTSFNYSFYQSILIQTCNIISQDYYISRTQVTLSLQKKLTATDGKVTKCS